MCYKLFHDNHELNHKTTFLFAISIVNYPKSAEDKNVLLFKNSNGPSQRSLFMNHLFLCLLKV